MRFEALSPEESGIDLINPLDPENPMSFLYYSGVSCGGVAIGDNGGDGTFTDVSDQVGIAGRGDGLAATWWDYNDDGYPDIYVGNDFAEPDLLDHNKGDGTFRNVLNDGSGNSSLRALPRLTQASPTFGAALADLDGDLNLDAYLVQNLFTPQ